MTYFVSVSVPSGHQYSIPAPTLSEAIASYREEIAKPGHRSVRVFGDSYDVDCDAEGYFMAWDGLSDSERERVESAGRTSGRRCVHDVLTSEECPKCPGGPRKIRAMPGTPADGSPS